jgi:ribosomal-protein-alanine N-acetyltransferase
MSILESERLLIRNFKTSDWEPLHEMIKQYESSELAAYDQQWPTSPEEIKKITEWFAGGENYLAVCLKTTGRFIGFVSLNPEQKEDCREFNIGYIFNFNYHGKGYATEACRAVINHAFDRLQAQKIISGTAAENIASCRLLERSGFKRMAESMSSFKNNEVGKPIEFVGCLYAISREEWEAASQDGSI